MVGTLVRLKLKLFARSASRNAGVLAGLVAGGLFLSGFVFLAVLGLVLLRPASVALTGVLTTILFAAITVMWPFITLLMTGVDQTLDPGRFALFPLRARQMQPGLFVADLISLGGIATLIVVIASLVSWAKSPLSFVAAVIAGVLGVMTCALLARTLTAGFSAAINSRRFRDVAAALLAIVLMTIGVGMQAILGLIADDPEQIRAQLQPIATVAGWTPLGWAWAIPWSVASGHWLSAVARLVLAGGLVAFMWWRWRVSLAAALISPLETSGSGQRVRGQSLADALVPRSRAGAIAARSLRYWRRDPRHIVSIVGVSVMPFVMFAPLFFQPGGASYVSASTLIWYPIASVLLISGMVVATEINYDGSALWMPITAGVSGRDDRWGRLIAAFWVQTPIIVAIDIVFMVMARDWYYLPILLGATMGVLMATSAVGTVTGAIWQYPVPPPGQNAFARSSGGGVTGLISTVVAIVASAVVSVPFLIATGMAETIPAGRWLPLLLAAVLGPLMVWGAVVLGGRTLDQRWPEVLKRVTFEKS